MCTLAVYRDVSPRYPLIVAANRDEFLGRASAAPHDFVEAPGVFAGRDLVAGGTWLGARTDGSGRIVGLLNRRPAPDRAASGPGERSRGLLCLEALAATSLDAVVASLDAREASRYGGFNLFVAEPGRALVLDNGSGLRTTPLDEGLSVLTNLDVNDPRCPRLAGAATLFAALTPRVAAGESAADLLASIAEVLGDHGLGLAGSDGPLSRVCVHADSYGTRSSSVIFVDVDGRVEWFHAEGPPCTAPFFRVR